MKPKRWSREARMGIQAGVLAAVLLIGFAAAMLASSRLAEGYASYQLAESIQCRKQSILASVEAQCRGVTRCAQTLKDQPGALEDTVRTAPEALFATSDAIKVALVDERGLGINTQGEETDLSGTPFFERARNGEAFAVGVGVSPVDGQSVFVITAPVYRGGEVAFVLAAAYRVADINESLMASLDSDGYAFALVDSQGRLLLSGAAREDIGKAVSGQNARNAEAAAALKGALAEGTSGYVTYLNHGETWYCAYADMGINDWRLVYRVQELETGYVGRRNLLYLHGLLALSMGVFFWLALGLISRERKNAAQIMLEDQNLRASRECLRMLSEYPGAIVCDTDLRTGKTFVYGGFTSAFGRDPILTNFPMDAARGGMIAEDDARKVRDVMEQARHGVERAQVDADVRRADGGYRRCRYLMRMISDENGKPFRVIGRIMELNEQADDGDMDEIDGTTALFRRHAAQERMNDAIAAGPCSLLLLDIDNSSRIEEEAGRDGIETALSTAARVLRAVAGPEDILGRLGGDEFAMLVRGGADEAELRDRMTRLLAGMESEGEKLGYALSGSVGCAMSPRDGASFDELYFKADTAQYIAKQSGKKRFLIYRES